MKTNNEHVKTERIEAVQVGHFYLFLKYSDLGISQCCDRFVY